MNKIMMVVKYINIILFCTISYNISAQSKDSLQEERAGNVSGELQELRLQAGESQVIDIGFNISKLGVGSPDVVEVTRTAPNQMLINAVKDGKTNILLWEEDKVKLEYQVIVGKLRNADTLAKDILNLLSGIEGISARVVGDQVVLEGEVYSRNEQKKVESVVSALDGVINLVQTGDLYNRLLAEEIQKTIGIEGVEVRYTKNGYILEGLVVSEAELEYAKTIADSFATSVISALYIDPDSLAERPINGAVKLELTLLEVSKDSFADFANDFTVSGNIGLSASSASGGDTALGGLTISDENLRKLQDEGRGRVILQHSLLSESGQGSTLFVGDELPIPVNQGNGAISIDYKPIGLTVNYTPSIYRDNTITLQVAVESSTIVGEGFGGAPQISNLELNTSSSVNDRQSIVLAGLIKQRQLDSYFGSADRGFFSKFSNRKKDTSTGEGDGRRSFFDSKSAESPNRFTNERREVIVIVKPTIVENRSTALKKVQRAVERSFKDYELDRYKDLDVNKLDAVDGK